jgi:hypothetical protein
MFGGLFKRCDHDYEVIVNDKIYETTSNLYAQLLKDMTKGMSNYVWKETKFTLTSEILNALNDKNVSKEEFLEAVQKGLERDENANKQNKKSINDDSSLFNSSDQRAIGVCIVQRCNKCGKLINM